MALKAGDGIAFEIKMKVDLEETDASGLEIDLRCGEGRKTTCTFDFKHGVMQVDRNASDGWSKGVSSSTLFLKGKKELDIHIYSDQSSLEIFADQYHNNHANNTIIFISKHLCYVVLFFQHKIQDLFLLFFAINNLLKH